jgi:hypothetical protein
MNRRTTSSLTAMTFLGLAIAALPQAGFAQSDPTTGLWQLNPAKSRYTPGLPPKSQRVYIQAEGQNLKLRNVGVSAEGDPTSAVTMWIFDGMPHPVTGNPNFDGVASTRVRESRRDSDCRAVSRAAAENSGQQPRRRFLRATRWLA